MATPQKTTASKGNLYFTPQPLGKPSGCPSFETVAKNLKVNADKESDEAKTYQESFCAHMKYYWPMLSVEDQAAAQNLYHWTSKRFGYNANSRTLGRMQFNSMKKKDPNLVGSAIPLIAAIAGSGGVPKDEGFWAEIMAYLNVDNFVRVGTLSLPIGESHRLVPPAKRQPAAQTPGTGSSRLAQSARPSKTPDSPCPKKTADVQLVSVKPKPKIAAMVKTEETTPLQETAPPQEPTDAVLAPVEVNSSIVNPEIMDQVRILVQSIATLPTPQSHKKTKEKILLSMEGLTGFLTRVIDGHKDDVVAANNLRKEFTLLLADARSEAAQAKKLAATSSARFQATAKSFAELKKAYAQVMAEAKPVAETKAVVEPQTSVVDESTDSEESADVLPDEDFWTTTAVIEPPISSVAAGKAADRTPNNHSAVVNWKKRKLGQDEVQGNGLQDDGMKDDEVQDDLMDYLGGDIGGEF